MAWNTVEYDPSAVCVLPVVDLHDSCVYGVGYYYEEDICLEVWGVTVVGIMPYLQVRQDVCLKICSVAQGKLRAVKTLGESDSEPTSWSLRQGTHRRCFYITQFPLCYVTFIRHTS